MNESTPDAFKSKRKAVVQCIYNRAWGGADVRLHLPILYAKQLCDAPGSPTSLKNRIASAGVLTGSATAAR